MIMTKNMNMNVYEAEVRNRISATWRKNFRNSISAIFQEMLVRNCLSTYLHLHFFQQTVAF